MAPIVVFFFYDLIPIEICCLMVLLVQIWKWHKTNNYFLINIISAYSFQNFSVRVECDLYFPALFSSDFLVIIVVTHKRNFIIFLSYLFLAKFVILLLHRIFDDGHSPSGCVNKYTHQKTKFLIKLLSFIWQTDGIVWFMYIRERVWIVEKLCGWLVNTGLQKLKAKAKKYSQKLTHSLFLINIFGLGSDWILDWVLT